MNAAESSARLSVHDLDDLIGLVPYLVGFPPRSSLVVVVVESGQVCVTARVDLAPLTRPAAIAGLIARLFDRFPDGEAWCLAYTEDLSLAWSVLNEVAECVGEERLGRLVQVGDQRWRADHAAGLSGQVRSGPAAAQAAQMGMALLDCRAALADQVCGPIDPDDPQLIAEFEVAAGELASLARGARRRRGLLLAANASSRADLIRLAVLAADPEVQRAVVETLDAASAPTAVQRWSAVVAECPSGYATAPLGLLGVAGWLTGDGALQTVCLERLDQLDPSVPLAAMLDWINVTVLPPAAWPTYRAALVGALADHARLLASPEPA